jgi:hypothetical protein
LISLSWRLIPLANWHATLVNRITRWQPSCAFRPTETAHLRFVAGKIELDHRVGWMQARRPRQNRVGRESIQRALRRQARRKSPALADSIPQVQSLGRRLSSGEHAPSNSTERWEQIKTAFASGIGLRELVRNMGVSENTSLPEHALRQLIINDQSLWARP